MRGGRGEHVCIGAGVDWSGELVLTRLAEKGLHPPPIPPGPRYLPTALSGGVDGREATSPPCVSSSPPRYLPTALVGWTGSRQFMRFLRSASSRKGLKFSPDGIFDTGGSVHRWGGTHVGRYSRWGGTQVGRYTGGVVQQDWFLGRERHALMACRSAAMRAVLMHSTGSRDLRTRLVSVLRSCRLGSAELK